MTLETPVVRPNRARSLSRFFGFFALFYGFVLIPFVFQNCGQSSFQQQEILPASSPFAAQRVYFKSNDVALKDKTSADLIPVAVIINNKCAKEQCSTNDAGQSVACQLTEKQMIPQLADYVQSYSWKVPATSSEKSLNDYLSRHQADLDCIVGVSIERSYQTTTVAVPNDPLGNLQYHHDVIHTNEAYDTFDIANLPRINVGVIDSGIDNHEDIGSLDWGNVGGGGCSTICNFHGTFVAGIIGARRNNAVGVYGIAPNANLIGYRVGDASGTIPSVQIYNSVTWSLLVDKIDIMNLSLGGQAAMDQALQDSFVRLLQKEVIIVVAAGNSNMDIGKTSFFPASFNYDGQVNVAAASPQVVDPAVAPPYVISGSPIVKDGYSNYSSAIVHIAAPGQAIQSTSLKSTYARASGTSFAAPMVSASLAILKGYLKKNGFASPPASILKQILLEGSTTIDGLKTSVAGGKYLNLVSLKASADQFISLLSGSSGPQVAILSSETVVKNGNKVVHVEMQVSGANPALSQILRVYTSKAFLADSYTGLSCSITQERQFCSFDVPFNALYSDPELYFSLVNADGTIMADLTVPKADLQLGSREESTLDGEISNVVARPGYFHAEGWSCLKGFPDEIEIEVRVNSATSTPIRKLKTIRQARGAFFDRCAAPSIDFGFTFVAPNEYLTSGSPSRFFFKAIHSGTGKSLALPVTVYQPGYNDKKPATYTDSAYLDPYWIHSNANTAIKITKREFSDWILKVEGTACNWNSKTKTLIQLVDSIRGQPLSLVPELWDDPKYTSTIPKITTAEAKITYENHGWTFTNSTVLPTVQNLGAYSCSGSFSDITYPCIYNDNRTSVVNFLLPVPYINGFYPPATSATTLETYAIQNVPAGNLGGFLTVEPSVVSGDSCPYPSGFSFNLDLRNYIQSAGFNAGISYRSDLVTKGTVLAALGRYANLFQDMPKRAFSELRFTQRAFDLQLLTSSGTTFSLFASPDRFTSVLATYNAIPSAKLRQWDSLYGGPSNGSDALPIWVDKPALALTASADTTLKTLWTSDWVPVKNANSRRLFAGAYFASGTAFGTLDTDITVEFSINGTDTWYKAPLDVLNQIKETAGIRGQLMVDVDLPEETNSIRLRLRANGKNAMTLKTVGFSTE